MESIYDVLRMLVSAVFKSGAVTDADHARAHEVIDGADPSVAEEKRRAATELTDQERAELERLQAKQAAQQQAGQQQPNVVRAATPGAGFHQGPEDPNTADRPAGPPNPPAESPYGSGPPPGFGSWSGG